jgi:Diguanylate cyclase, GGDEF domain
LRATEGRAKSAAPSRSRGSSAEADRSPSRSSTSTASSRSTTPAATPPATPPSSTWANSAQAVLRPTDLLSRVGGDEFVLVLPDTDYDEGTAVIRRIQGRLAEADSGEPASITAGLVTWRSAPQSIEQLFVEADALMYSAKRGGGDHHLESQVIG